MSAPPIYNSYVFLQLFKNPVFFLENTLFESEHVLLSKKHNKSCFFLICGLQERDRCWSPDGARWYQMLPEDRRRCRCCHQMIPDTARCWHQMIPDTNAKSNASTNATIPIPVPIPKPTPISIPAPTPTPIEIPIAIPIPILIPTHI